MAVVDLRWSCCYTDPWQCLLRAAAGRAAAGRGLRAAAGRGLRAAAGRRLRAASGGLRAVRLRQRPVLLAGLVTARARRAIGITVRERW